MITQTEANAIMSTTLVNLKDATVERHYWAVMAINAEAMIEVMSDPLFADDESAARIAECKKVVDECKFNAVNHIAVPDDMRDAAESMFAMSQYRQQ